MTIQEQLRAWPLPLGSDDDEFRNIVADRLDELETTNEQCFVQRGRMQQQTEALEADKAELLEALAQVAELLEDLEVPHTPNGTLEKADRVLAKHGVKP